MVKGNPRRYQHFNNILRLDSDVGRPTFAQLKMIGVAIIQSAGCTVFIRPNAFVLNDPRGYFRAGIVRKMIGDRKLSSWSTYRGARIPRNRAGAVPHEEVRSLHGPHRDSSGTSYCGRHIAEDGW